MQRPSLLMDEEPLDALCHHFNVSKTPYGCTSLPATFDMPILRDSHMPTHVLAVQQSDSNSATPPLMLPIDARLYEQGFRVELNLPQVSPGSTLPTPHPTESATYQVVTLPVIPITVPHVASLPLLLLFGMCLETQPNSLAWRLLPPQVIEEFPNAAAMAQILSRLRDEKFLQHVRYNQGIWKNVLALGLRDIKLVELIQTAWNVTAEARRIRQREQQQR